MGQYYKASLINDEGKLITLSSHDFENGSKLMEHSWLGNKFVTASMYILSKCPLRLIWCGDYAEVPEDINDSATDEQAAILEDFIPKCWDIEPVDKADERLEGFEYEKDVDNLKIIINHSKKEYIDLDEYEQAQRDRTGIGTEGFWCIHPLPLLTCVGNGKGGGDYSGADSNMVGYWAGDMIEVVTKDKLPLLHITGEYENVSDEFAFEE